MLGSLLHSAKRALSPGLLATGVFGASTIVAYQLDWLSVMLSSLGIVIEEESSAVSRKLVINAGSYFWKGKGCLG